MNMIIREEGMDKIYDTPIALKRENMCGDSLSKGRHIYHFFLKYADIWMRVSNRLFGNRTGEDETLPSTWIVFHRIDTLIHHPIPNFEISIYYRSCSIVLRYLPCLKLYQRIENVREVS